MLPSSAHAGVHIFSHPTTHDELRTMSDNIELQELNKKPELAGETSESRKHGRINLDANQEQAITLWAYGATVM